MAHQFVVPQNLTVEPKIIGPITMRQFLWLLGATGVLFLAYKLLTIPYFSVVALFVAPITLSFAFVKINGLPFQYFLLNVFQTLRRPRLRVWSKEYNDTELKQFMNRELPEIAPPVQVRERPSESRLAKLALVVNTGGSYNPEDESVLLPSSSQTKK